MNKDELDNYELANNAAWIHESAAIILIKQIKGHTDSIVNCQFILNDTRIFTVSNDQTARTWCSITGEQLSQVTNLHESTIARGRVNQENTKFVTCSWDSAVKYWCLKTGAKLWQSHHEYMVTSCDVSSDNQLVASVSDVDYLIFVWDALTGKLVKRIADLVKTTCSSLHFSPNNDRLITTSYDKTCRVYDLKSDTTTISLTGHTGVISNAAFTSDQRFLATTSWDKTINVWDVSTGAYRLTGATSLVGGHEGSVSSCKISEDGALCVSVGYDTNVTVWDTSISKPKMILKSHTCWVNDVDISRDKKWIVSAGKDGDMLQWNIENIDKIKTVVNQKMSLNIISNMVSV